MNPTVWLYLVYIAISIALTVWVAQTLHKNGRIFLVDCFGGNEPMADSVNHLLLVGFYLINLGYVTLALKTDSPPADTQQIIENLSGKIGIVLLVLGGMHFLNLFVFHKLRNRDEERHTPPPFPPTAYTIPPVPQE
jgi:H+/Cl- antiporter ClcA